MARAELVGSGNGRVAIGERLLALGPRALAVLLLAALTSGCGGASTEPPSTVPPEPSASEAPPSPLPPASFEIHEWGLLSYPRAAPDGEGSEGLAGSGPYVEQLGRGGGRSAGVGYKPVIYAHVEAGREARFSIEVGASRVLESWPPSERPEGVGWRDVVARGSASCGPFGYPAAPSACHTSDAYCEAMNAAHYEASDGACLVVDGAEHDHLLYRAEVSRGVLPMDVAREADADALVVRPEGRPRRLFRVSVDRGRREVRAVAFDAPAPGSRGPLPEPREDAAGEVADELFAGTGTAGLTEPEQQTFRRVWEEAIFGASGDEDPFTLLRRVLLEPRVRPTADALYYWLDAADVERILPMRIDPAPSALRRAFLVRIALVDEPGTWVVRRGPSEVRMNLERVTGLDRDRGQSMMHRRINTIRACFDDFLPPELSGAFRVRVDLHLDAEGHMDRLQVEGAPAPFVEECIYNMQRFSLDHPLAPEGIGVRVRYDVRVEPAEDRDPLAPRFGVGGSRRPR